jgi:hypothetical protein
MVVKIPAGAYPELLTDLAGVAPRERAERLRLLATIGLRDLRRSASLDQSEHHPAPSTLASPAGPSDEQQRARTIIRKLVQGL